MVKPRANAEPESLGPVLYRQTRSLEGQVEL